MLVFLKKMEMKIFLHQQRNAKGIKMATEKEIASYIQNDCNEGAIKSAKNTTKAEKMCVEYSLGEKYMLPSEGC